MINHLNGITQQYNVPIGVGYSVCTPYEEDWSTVSIIAFIHFKPGIPQFKP